MEKDRIYVSEEDEGVRLDVFLAETFEDYSRSYIQKLIKENMVTVNGGHEKSKYLMKTGDDVTIEIPPPKKLEVLPQNIPIEIVYEDDALLVVNKPQDMVVHPAPGNYEGTLVNALLYHCRDNLSTINGVIRPGIVHRIDKDTTGLLVVAKTDAAHRSLAQQLKEHTITRKYNAIAMGNIKEHQATIDAPIGRHPIDRMKMTVIHGGRKAITHIRVLERFSQYSFIEAQLETGRTHQIRVHLAYIKHPLLGDEVYGNKSSRFNLRGQVLHAKTLGFKHPSTGEYIEFDAPIPEYFQKLLTVIRSNTIRDNPQ